MADQDDLAVDLLGASDDGEGNTPTSPVFHLVAEAAIGEHREVRVDAGGAEFAGNAGAFAEGIREGGDEEVGDRRLARDEVELLDDFEDAFEAQGDAGG